MNVPELKLARPREIPLLKMAGYEVVSAWSQSFTLMHISRETKSVPEKQVVSHD